MWLLAKLYKEKEDLPTYVLGKDVNVDKVASLYILSLIGCWEYIRMNRAKMVCWVSDHWCDSLDHIPKVNMLMNGWFVFYF